MNRKIPTLDQLLGVDSLVCKDNQPKAPKERIVKHDPWGYVSEVVQGHASKDLSAMERIQQKARMCFDFTVRNQTQLLRK